MKTDDILTFLSTAPDEIRPWAEEQRQRLLHPESGVKPTRFQRLTSTWGKPLLMAAVIAAVVFGVYYIGKPPAEPVDTAAPPAMGEAAKQQVDVARMAELTAQVEADPSDIDARLELGVLLMGAGDPEGAEEQWVAVTELDSQRIEPWYNLGFLYLSRQPADEAKAREAWEKVLEIDPDFPQAEVIKNHMPGG
ncbi:MAG: tetratricopeptide repeat protein [Propionibacteriaceae bacterium]|nr:tetratricopeptide repeat protein [Propionibacteriaceae bacterium]